MKNVTTASTRSAASSSTVNLTTNHNLVNVGRQQQLQQQFARNAEHVRQEASQPGLLVADEDRLISAALHHHCHNYTGSPYDDAEFRAWISGYIHPKVERLRVFYEMRAAHRKIVHKGLWAVIKMCLDLGGDVDTVHELEQSVWSRIWADIEGWAAPSYGLNGRKPARLSSRLYAFARAQALGWRTTRLRERAKFADAEEAARVGYDPDTGARFVEPKNYGEMWSQAA